MRYIKTSSLSKVYNSGFFQTRKIEALREISFEVAEGEILAILGINGSGKSTLIKVLLSLIRPTGGSFELFEMSPKIGKWRGKVGYLPENFRLRMSLTPTQFLSTLGVMNYLRGRELLKRIEKVLSDVGMAGVSSQRASEFSKGMVQRLGIAQAVLHDPNLLFLDEPTDGLDPAGRKLTREILLGWKQNGKSVVLNSHLLSEVELVADRVMILHKGKILALGKLSELLPADYTFCVTVSSPPLSYHGTGKNERGESGITYYLHGNRELTEFVHQAHVSGITIYSILPQKENLEDVFLRNIQE